MKWKGKVNFELRPQLNGSNIILTEGTGEINAITEKSPLVGNDIVLIEDSAASYAKKKATITDVRPVFGSSFAQSSSEAESTTTSTAWQQKVTLSVSGLIAGVYRLGWYAETRHSSISNDINLRIQQNNTTDLALTNIEPKDSSNYFPQSGFVYVTLAASTSYNFDMDYSTESGSSTSTIRRARLEFWRLT